MRSTRSTAKERRPKNPQLRRTGRKSHNKADNASRDSALFYMKAVDQRERRRKVEARYRSRHPEKIAEKKRRYAAKYPDKEEARRKRYEHKYPERVKESKLRYARNHPEKNWAKANPDKRRAYARTWQNNKNRCDINFRIANQLRHRLYICVKRKSGKKCNKALVLLGCSLEDFIIYIESKFEPGMSWENYGKFGWHIDHIIPCAIFDLAKPDHQRRCFHFSNMQPLWAKDNLRKHKKIQQESICTDDGPTTPIKE